MCKSMCCVKSDFGFKVMYYQTIRPISDNAGRSEEKPNPFNSDQYASNQASPTPPPHTHQQAGAAA